MGGIAIKEHFEVNVSPLNLQLTRKFAKTIKHYFFPQRNKHKRTHSTASAMTGDRLTKQNDIYFRFNIVKNKLLLFLDEAKSAILISSAHSVTSSSHRRNSRVAPTATADARDSVTMTSRAAIDRSMSVTSSVSKRSSKAGSSDVTDGAASLAEVDELEASHLQADDIGKMKERASKNQMFLFVKVPEVHLTVTYKVRYVPSRKLGFHFGSTFEWLFIVDFRG